MWAYCKRVLGLSGTHAPPVIQPLLEHPAPLERQKHPGFREDLVAQLVLEALAYHLDLEIPEYLVDRAGLEIL